jgi:anaerobic magnesium-protoporphyrin IX monomethyl ester cyclase
MKVTFIHFVVDVLPSYSHAIASLAGSVRKYGTDVELVTVRERKLTDTVNEIKLTKPDIVCFSYMSNQREIAKSLANLIKLDSPNLPIWAGGSDVNASLFSIGNTVFDALCYGEGEHLLPLALDFQRTGQTFSDQSWIKNPVRFAKMPQPAIIEQLDSIALPMVELFDKVDVLNYPSLMFSRGCPFKCTYCMSRKGGIGNKVRWKSPERSLIETKQLVTRFNPEEIYFDDDTFLKNPKWVRSFLHEYKKYIDRPYYCNARPEVITKELCKLLANTGCKAIGIGVESGSEHIRDKVLGRSMTNELIKTAFDYAHGAGLLAWSFNMIGLPGERLEDLESTIQLNNEIKTDYVRVSIYTPYPGTPLGDSIHASSLSPSYFLGVGDLDINIQKLADEWINKLRLQGRLWNDE